MPKADRLREAIGDAYGETDEIVTDLADEVSARRVELLMDPTKRNLDVWTDGFIALGIDEAYLDVPQYEMQEVSLDERDAEWLSIVAAIHACADVQATTEIAARPLMREAENGAREIVKNALGLDELQLKRLATEGVTKVALDEGKKRAKARRGKGD